VVSEIPTDWNVNEGIYVLTPDERLVLPDFLRRALQSRDTTARLRSVANGSTILHVSMADLRRIRIPVPPLPVQREIVRLLDVFETLEADLEAELEARRVQYVYYRDSLLVLAAADSRRATL